MSQIEPMPEQLLNALRELIRQGRQRALHAVDTAQVQTYWHVCRHIVEFEQGGQTRAEYGKRLLARLADALIREFGTGFDERNLRNMRAFFIAFPIRNALRSELCWTHYRMLLRVHDTTARQWYMIEAANQNWSTRALDRQIGTLYYERLLSSRDKAAVTTEANTLIATQAAQTTPRDFVRDPVLLEFLGLPDSGRLLESGLGNKP